MLSNKRIIFIAKLYRETELSRVNAESLVKKIDEKYLDDAIKEYKESGLVGLDSFVKGLELLN